MVSMPELSEVDVFTDGACRGNPGPGGWAAILRYRGTEKELSLEVRDNGRGFDVAAARLGATAGRSMGLLSMEERATLAGGRLAIDSAPSRETRLSLTLPLVRAGAEQV